MSQGVLTSPQHQVNIQLSGTGEALQATVHTYHPADGESHITSQLNGDVYQVLKDLYDYLMGTSEEPSHQE